MRDKQPKQACEVCGSTVSVQSYTIAVDGAPLVPHNRIPLCQEHGDRFLFRVGALVAAMIIEARR